MNTSKSDQAPLAHWTLFPNKVARARALSLSLSLSVGEETVRHIIKLACECSLSVRERELTAGKSV